ncbi:MAG: hypothetical protein Q8R92_17605, partial [Deltaproteobacteria bacterium]|nr:hypothetical protein [Deltaproteobacteria bacterium]
GTGFIGIARPLIDYKAMASTDEDRDELADELRDRLMQAYDTIGESWPSDGTVDADRELTASDTVAAAGTDAEWISRLLNQTSVAATRVSVEIESEFDADEDSPIVYVRVITVRVTHDETIPAS